MTRGTGAGNDTWRSGGFGLILGFAFFVEAAAVDVVYDRDGEVLHLQAANSKDTIPIRSTTN